MTSESKATLSPEQEIMHAHTHEHADGTIHSHYHRHAGGNVAHNHETESRCHDDCSLVELDTAQESHAHGEVPFHNHDQTAKTTALLVAENLAYAYPHTKRNVFSDISLEARAGSMLAILGNNGAGKSTLLDLLAGISSPKAGRVAVCGEDVSTLGRRQIAQRIAYVAQQQTVPHLSVYDEVLLGRKPHISWSITQADRDIVASAISDLGLEDFAKRYCDELSGGERQKVFIARALAQEPQVMFLDEPTSALDPKNQLEVLRVLRDITRRNNIASVLVIHDINLALRFCDRFVLVRDGEVVASGGHDAVTDETLTLTYDTPFAITEVKGVRMAVPVDELKGEFSHAE